MLLNNTSRKGNTIARKMKKMKRIQGKRNLTRKSLLSKSPLKAIFGFSI